jgi:16S rRNA (cytosine967-C5)-methyltransferase
MTNARAVAFDLLQRWNHSRRFADELLADHAGIAALPAADRALAMELFYGCLRQRLALDFLLDRQVTQPPRAVVRDLLRLGLYQLVFLRTPAHAAVHETVALAKQHAAAAEAKFVNAVLRRATPAALERAEPWVRLSHPQWLYERHGAAWCEWNNQPPPVYVRGNQPWPGVLEPTPLHPLCYRVVDAPRFFAAPGKYYVQDPSTLLAVDVLDPQPGETVLDLCAAPGGKTTYIAQKMQHRGQVVAHDSSASRLALVGENCRRLGVEIVTLAHQAPKELFDRVLVDAPCSNTGVMRRRPDLRWRITPAEIARLAQTQRRLLAAAAAVTRPGGVLVYSTCSLEPEENEQVAGELPGFTRAPPRALVPPRDGMDGAFVTRYRRR